MPHQQLPTHEKHLHLKRENLVGRDGTPGRTIQNIIEGDGGCNVAGNVSCRSKMIYIDPPKHEQHFIYEDD